MIFILSLPFRRRHPSGHGKRGTSHSNPSCRSQSDSLPHGRCSQMKQMSLSPQDSRTVGSHLNRHQLLGLLREHFQPITLAPRCWANKIYAYIYIDYHFIMCLYQYQFNYLIWLNFFVFCENRNWREMIGNSDWAAEQYDLLCCIFINPNDTLMKTELNCLRHCLHLTE